MPPWSAGPQKFSDLDLLRLDGWRSRCSDEFSRTDDLWSMGYFMQEGHELAGVGRNLGVALVILLMVREPWWKIWVHAREHQ